MEGRLTHFQEYWRNNVKDKWALEIVQQGYTLEFERDPPPPSCIRETHCRGLESNALLREEKDFLLAKNAIELVPQENKHRRFYSQLFLVKKKAVLSNQYST